MDILEKTEKELLEIARPMWDDLVKYSNNSNYGAFTRNFSEEMLRGANEIEMGKQFARSELTMNLHEDVELMGTSRREKHVTVLFNQRHKKKPGEWLGRLVLGYEDDEVKIFGATIF
jgi:hypothetical protein